MADNANLTGGDGTLVAAADDIGGVKFQRIKVIHGIDGVNDGDVSTANPFPVVQTGASALPTGAATAAKQDTGNTSLSSIDGKITAVNTGAVVVSSSALPTGAATSANQLPDNHNVVVTSAPTTAVTGTFWQATQPVSLAAGAAAIAKAEDVASADADVGVPAMAVRKATPANTSGTDGDYEMLQISEGRLWVSALIDAALPAGTNAIGKLAANSGVDIGDVDVTSVTPGTAATNLGKAEDAAHSSSDVGVMALAVSNENQTAFGAASGDYTPVAVNRYGTVYIGAPVPTRVSSNGTPITATTTGVIAAPSAGNHLRVMRIHLSNGGATATWVAIRDGAAGTQYYRTYLVQGASISLNLRTSGTLDLTTATRLDIVLSAAGSVEYGIDYMTVAD